MVQNLFLITLSVVFLVSALIEVYFKDKLDRSNESA